MESSTVKTRLKIISGGQTGVDRAALNWALAQRIPHGGWCPKGRKAEDGIIPPQYQLRETPGEEYSARTRQNVLDSEGTVVFSRDSTRSGGTKETVEFAREIGRPLLLLTSDTDIQAAADRLNRFLREHHITELNVAGPRESEAPGLSEFVQAVLSRLNR